jgi:hypothetical protein
LVEADNDPTMILKTYDLSEKSDQTFDTEKTKSKGKTFWKSKKADDSKDLQPAADNSQKMIITDTNMDNEI